jgi:hypothetical protein
MQIHSIINDVQKHVILLYFQINGIYEYQIIPSDPQQFRNWLIVNYHKQIMSRPYVYANK